MSPARALATSRSLMPLLGHGVGPGLLAHVDDFRRRRGLFEELRAGQLVVDHHLGPAQHRQTLHRNQPRISGPGAD